MRWQPRRGPGRMKWKLATMLRAEGFDVRPEDIVDAKGHWRTSPYADVYRWEATAKINGHICSIDSWDTMTDCIKGFTVEEEHPWSYMVHARPLQT